MRLEPGGDGPQRPTRRDLRLTTAIDKPAGTDTHFRPVGGPFDLEGSEPLDVHRLERERLLKPRLGCGVQLAGRLERLFAVQLEPIAPETEGPAPCLSLERGVQPRIRTCSPRRLRHIVLQLPATGRTQAPGALALQFPAWKRGPFDVCSVQNVGRLLRHMRAV